MYTINALLLLINRRITWQTFLYAVRERPIAVAGKGGSYQIDSQELNR